MSAGVTVWRCEKEDRTCENAEVAQRELRGGSCEQRHARSARGAHPEKNKGLLSRALGHAGGDGRDHGGLVRAVCRSVGASSQGSRNGKCSYHSS